MSDELREQIAREIGQHTENCHWDVCTKSEQDAAFRSADHILSLISAAVQQIINPYSTGDTAFDNGGYAGFESCRQAVMRILKK